MLVVSFAAAPSEIGQLVRQARRWMTASAQDNEPAIAVLHANYGVATVDAVRQIAQDSAIQRAAGVTGDELLRAATRTQDTANARLLARCPGLAPRQPR